MKRLFDRTRTGKPILAPLAAGGDWRRAAASRLASLPPAAVPVAVTLGGGIVLLLTLGLFLGGGEQPSDPASLAASHRDDASSPPESAQAPSSAATADAPVHGDGAAPRDTAANAASTQTPPPAAGLWRDDELAGGREALRLAPPPSENELTAAIPPALPGGAGMSPSASVPVAETEEQMLALEEIQRAEVEADVGPPSDEWTAAIADAPGAALQPATTTKYVNMRAGPDDDAEVLLVVPALARIEAEAGCNWCAVSYNGRSGYIYKTFISYE